MAAGCIHLKGRWGKKTPWIYVNIWQTKGRRVLKGRGNSRPTGSGSEEPHGSGFSIPLLWDLLPTQTGSPKSTLPLKHLKLGKTGRTWRIPQITLLFYCTDFFSPYSAVSPAIPCGFFKYTYGLQKLHRVPEAEKIFTVLPWQHHQMFWFTVCDCIQNTLKNYLYKCESAWEVTFDICEIIQNRFWSNTWDFCLWAWTRRGEKLNLC